MRWPATETIVSHRNGGESFGEAFAMTTSTTGAAAKSSALRVRVTHEATQKPEVEG